MDFPLMDIVAWGVLALGVRSIFWHLQRWQLQEYRFDRTRTWWGTHDGIKNVFSLWFFSGILPRPAFTGRTGLIFMLFLSWSFVCWQLSGDLDFFWKILIWERTIWLWVMLSVLISSLPVGWTRRCLFAQSQMIIANSTARRVGITGSFGKSSTKTILGHLLTMKHGPDQVLVSPKNENTEVALARLIVDQSDFFNTGENKIFLAEMGAYARGEIEDVCVFVQPHIGVMTGINDQHIALFGSKEKQLAAKGELPKACTEKIFFPAEDPELTHWFDVQTLKAEVFPVSQLGIQIEISDHEKTVFVYRNQRFTLPWCGKFFVRNALLAIETAESLGVSLAESAIFLTTLPPLERALHMKKHASGALILEDLYSANPDGVLAAIDELGKVPGHKIFVGLPLRELGAKAESIHQQIFQRLAEVGAEVFWLKPDFEDIGKKLCGTQFHQDDQVLLAHMIEALSEQDGILLESRLPQDILDLFYV